MRILAVSTWYPYPPDNGSKIRTFYLLTALARAHDLTVLAFDPAASSQGEHGGPAGRDELTVWPVPVDPFRYAGLPAAVKFLSPIPVACWPSLQARRMVTTRLKAERWDAVLASDLPAAGYLAEAGGVTRILDIHSYLSLQLEERHVRRRGRAARLRTWVSWQKARRFEQRLFRCFDLCTAVSPRELVPLQHALAGSRTRAEVVPNGVDCALNRPGLFEAMPGTLVYSGSLGYAANFDAVQYFLTDILPLIRMQQPGARLTITGRNAGVDLSGLNLDSGAWLTGHVDDIRPIVAGADVCVVPIREGGGTRLKILEAMALGTPVVSTTKGAEGLAVTDGADIFLADDPQTFAERTVMLITDPALRARLAANARRLVETHYDWSSIGRQYVDLVEDSHRACQGVRT